MHARRTNNMRVDQKMRIERDATIILYEKSFRLERS